MGETEDLVGETFERDADGRGDLIDRRYSRRDVLARGAAVGLGGLSVPMLLSACGGESGGIGAPGASGALKIAVSTDTESLDPGFVFARRAAEMVFNLFETLTYGPVVEQDGFRVGDWTNPVGGFAESFELNDQKTEVVFKLRQDAQFASGNPLTMDDVVWTLERIASVGIGGYIYSSTNVDPKTGVQRIDDRTLKLTASSPIPYLATVFCITTTSILDSVEMKKHATADDPWATQWAANNGAFSGAYQIEKVTSGVGTELTVNPHTLRPKPAFDRVSLRVVPSVSDRLSLLRQGDVDIAEELSKQHISELEGDPNLQILSFPTIDQLFVGMHTKLGPFKTRVLRQAVNYAIPYDDIIANVFFGHARRMRGILPETTPTFDPTLPYYEYDPEKAQSLAKASGETPFDVELAFDSSVAEHASVAAIVQSALQPLGIRVTLRSTTPAAFFEGIFDRTYPFVVDAFVSWINDPAYILTNLIGEKGVGVRNSGDYDNPKVASLLEQGKATVDENLREEIFGELQRVVLEDAIWAPLVHPDFSIAIRKGLAGAVLYPNQFIYYGDLAPSPKT